jgi:hypothetical protein
VRPEPLEHEAVLRLRAVAGLELGAIGMQAIAGTREQEGRPSPCLESRLESVLRRLEQVGEARIGALELDGVVVEVCPGGGAQPLGGARRDREAHCGDQRGVSHWHDRVARRAGEHRLDQSLDRHWVGGVDQPLPLL